MKRVSVFFPLFIVAMMFLAFGCEKAEEAEKRIPVYCDLNAICEDEVTENMYLVYRVEVIGDVSLTELSYIDKNGQKIDQEPWAGFMTEFDVEPGAQIEISAKAIVRDGEVKISYEAQGENNHFEGNDFCKKYINE